MNASNDPRLPLAKPEPRRRAKARRDREEAAVAKAAREKVDDRDGYCRVAREGRRGAYAGRDEFRCDGPGEWAHGAGHRRSQTRGMAAEQRHATAHSLKLCRRHHGMEERGEMVARPLTPVGFDGRAEFEWPRTGLLWAEAS